MRRRRKTASQRRIARRRNKLIARSILILAIPIALLVSAGCYIINALKDKGFFNNTDYKDFIKPVVEETVELPEEPEEVVVKGKLIREDNIPEETVPEEIIPEESITEEIPEEVIPEEVIREEVIGTDLLDINYEFLDIDFAELLTINEDTQGWIHIDGTKVDYPIMQGVDNEYYSHRDIYGENDKNGSIYLDANNHSFEMPIYDLDDLNFLYGHHMAKGKMFATICKYKEQDFYEEYPFFVIYTPDGYAYKADVFAGVIYDGNDNSIYSEDFNFSDEEEFTNYMNYLKENSLISSDLSVEYGDKIVGLVTCTYENGMDGNLRFIVYARLSKQYTNELQREEGARLGLYK